MASINLIEVQLKIVVSLGVCWDNLPNGCSFEGISYYTVEEITYFKVKLMLCHGFLRIDDILQGFPKERLTWSSCHLRHYESLLEGGLEVLVDVTEIADVDSLVVKVVAELLGVEEVDLEGVHLDYDVWDVDEDVLRDVLELFAEARTIPSIVNKVRLSFLRVTVNAIVIDKLFSEEKGFIIRVIPD